MEEQTRALGPPGVSREESKLRALGSTKSTQQKELPRGLKSKHWKDQVQPGGTLGLQYLGRKCVALESSR